MRVRELSVILLGSALACSSIKPLVATSHESGTTLEMVQGQELVLTLDADHSSGYRWWLVDSSPIVLLPTERPAYEAGAGGGGGGLETWRFKAAQAGTQTLRFEYKKSAAEKESPAKTVSYTVVVVK